MMQLSGQILITGGSGTLGKAILTTAEREHWPARFSIYSRGEAVQAQMRARFPHARFILGDVRDYTRLEAACIGHDIVIHAAAMKRIPEAETQPYECWQTNVVGSQNVARACVSAGVGLCIGISTDKACQATTMYGASKLMMEKIFRAAACDGDTRFTLVRYGNVVSSRGSVIPIWREQAARGEPLTITNPDMTRFWMSPFTAVGIIIRAAGLSHGEIAVRKMKSLSLWDMAGIIAPDAERRIIGLRSEEKHHEDLVHPNEPSIDDGEYQIISARGDAHISYTSANCPRLCEGEFRAMLADAELLEAGK